LPNKNEGSSQREAPRKIAIITGGSRGLGRSTVLSLAERGIDSIFTFHTNHSEAEKVVALVAATGSKAFALPLDTRSVGTFDAFVLKVKGVLQAEGADGFDFLVNNAGTGENHPIVQTTEEEFDSLYQVHLKGVFFLTQKLLPLLRNGGRIVNISSGLTRFTIPGNAAYAAMKGAVEVLTRYLAKELGERGIAVNTVAPGAIATDFGGGVVRDNPMVNQGIASMTALGRVGLPEDIGLMIASLVSSDNRWVTGQRIEASGGMQL